LMTKKVCFAVLRRRRMLLINIIQMVKPL